MNQAPTKDKSSRYEYETVGLMNQAPTKDKSCRYEYETVGLMDQAPTKDKSSRYEYETVSLMDQAPTKDRSNPCRSYGQEGFCFLSVSYFVRILSKFQAVRGFR